MPVGMGPMLCRNGLYFQFKKRLSVVTASFSLLIMCYLLSKNAL